MSIFSKLFVTLCVIATVGATAGNSGAGVFLSVRIDDLTDTPTVRVFDGGTGGTGGTDITATSGLSILGDSAGEFLHFTLPDAPPALTIYRDLFEDQPGGILSDRLLVTRPVGQNVADIRFASDPGGITPGGATAFLPGLVENGNFQSMFIFGQYEYFVRSDPRAAERGDVPGPATLLLLGSGLAALTGLGWSRHRRA